VRTCACVGATKCNCLDALVLGCSRTRHRRVRLGEGRLGRVVGATAQDLETPATTRHAVLEASARHVDHVSVIEPGGAATGRTITQQGCVPGYRLQEQQAVVQSQPADGTGDARAQGDVAARTADRDRELRLGQRALTHRL